jgi:hypothetical protein
MLDEAFRESKKALLIGVGGGGDILGCIPTANYLKFLGAETILGGLTWERILVDPKPGPRRMDEIQDIELISETVGLASETTHAGKVRFTESIVAGEFEGKTVLVDINKGVMGTYTGLVEAIEKLGIDLVVGMDVGGDSLARGDEKGLRSPLADSTMLCVLRRLGERIPTFHGVIGCGCDGELTLDELYRNIAEIASRGGFLGARGMTTVDKAMLEKILPKTHSEASNLTLEAGTGGYGMRTIRDGRRQLTLTPMAAISLYFDPAVVYGISKPAKLIDGTTSLADADEILRKARFMTELYFEEKLAFGEI